MNRILVIRGGAIGDFVLTLPAIKLLRDGHPGAQLEILGYPHIVALAERRFYCDAVRSLESGSLASFFTQHSDLAHELTEYFARFDLVVSYLSDPERIFEQNVKRCTRGRFLACSHRLRSDEHASIQLALPLEQLGLLVTKSSPVLYPSADDRDLARRSYPDENMIALHPGSGSKTKTWPIQNWIALLEHLASTQNTVRFLIIGGEADKSQMAAFRRLGRHDLCFAESLALPHLAAVLERCALFLGHDSGVSHIAAAVETNCLLLFGPTDPAVWAPPNQNAHVLRSRSGVLADLALADVRAQVYELMRIGIKT